MQGEDEPNTRPWTEQQLAAIGNADEVALASRRPGGSLRPFVTIWADPERQLRRKVLGAGERAQVEREIAEGPLSLKAAGEDLAGGRLLATARTANGN